MEIVEKVKAILDATLNLGGRTASWDESTPLLGSVPELSSIAVITVLLSLEEEFNITVADDELDADSFASVGSLARFIQSKLGAEAVAR